MKAVLLVLAGFMAASPAPPTAAKPARQPCPEEKINFTKETGCRNDGYVQFCAADNKRARAAIKRIAPKAEKRTERHCDEGQTLFFLPVGVEQRSCVERWGAMTDKGWNQVCALARLPEVAGFRQVIFE